MLSGVLVMPLESFTLYLALQKEANLFNEENATVNCLASDSVSLDSEFTEV